METPTDDETLLAALAFIDAFDGERPKSAATTLAPAKRTRLELRALREEAVLLDKHAELLQWKREILETFKCAGSLESSAWEAVCSSQRARRRQAEIQNVQLRTRIDDQTRLIRRLRKLLHNKCWQKPQRMTTRPSPPLVQDVSSSFSQFGWEHLRLKTQQMCEFAPSISNSTQFTTLSQGTEPTKMVAPQFATSPSHMVEVTDSRFMPFEFHSLSDALWYYMTNHEVDEEMPSAWHMDGDDMCIAREVVMRSDAVGETRATVIQSKAVGRRCELPGGVLVVFAIELTTRVRKGKSTKTFSKTEQVWLHVQPITRKPQTCSALSPVSLVQTYLMTTPCMREVPVPTCKPNTWDESPDCFRSRMREHCERVESLMLDKAWLKAVQEHSGSPPC